MPTRSSSSRAAALGLGLLDPAHLDRAEGHVLQHGLVREQVEGLEHHADLGPQLGELLALGGSGRPSIEMLPVSIGSSRLMVRHSVDLPEPDGPDDHDDLAARDVEVDVLEHVEVAEVLVHALHPHERSVGGRGGGLRRSATAGP
jgi:hypothetical protein